MQSYYNSLMEENDEKILKSKLMKTDISGYIFPYLLILSNHSQLFMKFIF